MSVANGDPYMDWRPFAQHLPDCKRTGWDVRTYSLDYFDGRHHGVRAICPEVGGCGVVAEVMVYLAHDRDQESGDRRSGLTIRDSGVDRIGYGTRPLHIGDVWLHAGPPLLEDRDEGPHFWYVTRSQTPPTDRSETLGVVHTIRKDGRVLKSRFQSLTGWGPSKYGGEYKIRREDLTSRTAAARWVAEQADQLAAGGGA